MTKAIVNTIAITNEYRRAIMRILSLACVFAVILYAVNIYSLITKAIAIKTLETKERLIENHIRELDTQYMAITSKITPEMATNYGLTETPVSEYINRNGSIGAVARNSTEL